MKAVGFWGDQQPRWHTYKFPQFAWLLRQIGEIGQRDQWVRTPAQLTKASSRADKKHEGGVSLWGGWEKDVPAL